MYVYRNRIPPQKVGSPRPFNHIFGADRILEHDIFRHQTCRAAQEGARASARHTICGKTPTRLKSAQGRSARGPIIPKTEWNFCQPPYILRQFVVVNISGCKNYLTWNLKIIPSSLEVIFHPPPMTSSLFFK